MVSGMWRAFGALVRSVAVNGASEPAKSTFLFLRSEIPPPLPIATAKIEQLIVELKRDYTVAIVTHNMQQASRVADYTAFMYLGSLIEFGSTKDIFESPKNQLTEKYITGEFG